LRERFQKNFLRRIFHQTSFAKEPARNTKNSRTESFYYFSEGRLIAILRSLRQVEFGGLFNPTLQMRSSSEDGLADPDKIESARSVGETLTGPIGVRAFRCVEFRAALSPVPTALSAQPSKRKPSADEA